MSVRRQAFGVTLAMACLAGIQPAAAASWLELNFGLAGPRYDAVVPTCDSPWALQTISNRFSEKERTYWHSSASLQDFFLVREVAFRPAGPNFIPRRYCAARALLSDEQFGRTETAVYYSIGEDTGFAGASWGVNWCVVGYDRNRAYEPGCNMARP
jgi:hypothetical protein